MLRIEIPESGPAAESVFIAKTMWKLLQPPAHKPEIDAAKVDSRYRSLRLQVFAGIFIGYAGFYLVRKNFSMAIPELGNLGFDTSELSIVLSMNAIAYALSKFLMGSVSDRSNARVFLPLGLVLASLSMMFMIIPVTLLGPERRELAIIVMAVLNFLVGWFNGMGWPPCGRVMTHWFSQNERGTKMSVWNCAHNVGGALVGPMAVYGAIWFGSWFYGSHSELYFLIGTYLFPAVVSIFIALVAYVLIRDTPQACGLPSVEKWRNDYPKDYSAKQEEVLTTREIFFKYVLNNRLLWYIALANAFVYMVRYGCLDWAPTYLREAQGYDIKQAGWAYFAYEFAAIPGTLICGWLSDRSGDAHRRAGAGPRAEERRGNGGRTDGFLRLFPRHGDSGQHRAGHGGRQGGLGLDLRAADRSLSAGHRLHGLHLQTGEGAALTRIPTSETPSLGDRPSPQLPVEGFFMSAEQPVEQGVETRRMVVMDRMAEFVEDDEVAQMLGQGHQEEAQRDVVPPRATPPLRARGADRELFVFQAGGGRKAGDALRKVLPGGPAQLLDAGFALRGRELRRQGGATAGETFLCSEDPVGLLVEERQRPLPRHPEGVREPHGSRRPHADRDAPGPRRLRESHLPEPGMVDHLGGFGFYGDPAPGTPEIPSEPSEPSVPSDLFVSSAHSAPSGPFAFPFIPPPPVLSPFRSFRPLRSFRLSVHSAPFRPSDHRSHRE